MQRDSGRSNPEGGYERWMSGLYAAGSGSSSLFILSFSDLMCQASKAHLCQYRGVWDDAEVVNHASYVCSVTILHMVINTLYRCWLSRRPTFIHACRNVQCICMYIVALLYLYRHACKYKLFTDEVSRRLPQCLNYCFSVMASAANRSIRVYLRYI